MALRVNTNIAALNAAKTMRANIADLGTRLERLSSGVRIKGSADDAAGISITEGLRAQASGLTTGVRNAEMGAHMVQVADGALNEVNAMLIRMRELAVQASSSTMSDLNRESVEAEMTHLKQYVDGIAETAVYNDQILLRGFGNVIDETNSTAMDPAGETGVTNVSLSGVPAGTYTLEDSAVDGTISIGNGTVSQTVNINTRLDGNEVAAGTSMVIDFDRLGISLTVAGDGVSDTNGSYAIGDLDGKTLVVSEGTGGSFQVGATSAAEDRIDVSIADMNASGDMLNLGTVSASSQAGARDAITQLDQAIKNVGSVRGDLGAVMNRLQRAINSSDNSLENTVHSESAVRDADMAIEVTQFTRSQILTQAATAMLAQANSAPQQALGLLVQ
ncbi:MAG: flagellin [Planctomycetaceae bacterium]|nr:flagellin [Planctomycetaceae bacterium]